LTVPFPIIPVHTLECRFEPRPWRFAEDRRDEIKAHWSRITAANDQLWNGQVLLLHRFGFSNGVFSSGHAETDFASFLAWRDWGFPDRNVANCYAMAAILSADGAFLLGEMAQATANAGRIYFAAGTPEPGDVRADGVVDMAANVLREMTEETGLHAEDVTLAPGWTVCLGPARIALMKLVHSRLDAETLRHNIRQTLDQQAHRELADMVIVRSSADIDRARTTKIVAGYMDAWFAGTLPRLQES
jgi:8-oxo-dGTP pyrophosphatase MutT (NUDIX family)